MDEDWTLDGLQEPGLYPIVPRSGTDACCKMQSKTKSLEVLMKLNRIGSLGNEFIIEKKARWRNEDE